QIARAHLRGRDRLADRRLLRGRPRQRHAGGGPRPTGQPGAVPGVRPGGAVDVRVTKLRLREVDGLLRTRAALDTSSVRATTTSPGTAASTGTAGAVAAGLVVTASSRLLGLLPLLPLHPFTLLGGQLCDDVLGLLEFRVNLALLCGDLLLGVLDDLNLVGE